MASDGNLNEIAFCCPDLSTTSKLYNPINRVSRERQLWKLDIITKYIMCLKLECI